MAGPLRHVSTSFRLTDDCALEWSCVEVALDFPTKLCMGLGLVLQFVSTPG